MSKQRWGREGGRKGEGDGRRKIKNIVYKKLCILKTHRIGGVVSSKTHKLFIIWVPASHKSFHRVSDSFQSFVKCSLLFFQSLSSVEWVKCAVDLTTVMSKTPMPQTNRDGKAFRAQAQGTEEPFSGSITAAMND